MVLFTYRVAKYFKKVEQIQIWFRIMPMGKCSYWNCFWENHGNLSTFSKALKQLRRIKSLRRVLLMYPAEVQGAEEVLRVMRKSAGPEHLVELREAEYARW